MKLYLVDFLAITFDENFVSGACLTWGNSETDAELEVINDIDNGRVENVEYNNIDRFLRLNAVLVDVNRLFGNANNVKVSSEGYFEQY